MDHDGSLELAETTEPTGYDASCLWLARNFGSELDTLNNNWPKLKRLRRQNEGKFLMGVKEGCKPRSDVLQGELDDAIFAASFGKLVRDEGPDIYRQPALFFQNTHPTTALSKLCRDVFGRLASASEAGAVLR